MGAEACHTLQNVIPAPAGGFPPDTASSTRPKAQTWPQFNHIMSWTEDLFVYCLPTQLLLKGFPSQIVILHICSENFLEETVVSWCGMSGKPRGVQ